MFQVNVSQTRATHQTQGGYGYAFFEPSAGISKPIFVIDLPQDRVSVGRVKSRYVQSLNTQITFHGTFATSDGASGTIIELS
jgi:hypothetical protein